MAAGAGAVQGQFGGDGGAAVEAPLARPSDVFVDEARGDLYVADTGSGLVRRVDLESGIIETLVGTLVPGAPLPDGTFRDATSVDLGRPTSLAFDPLREELFLVDAARNQVLEVELQGGGVPQVRVVDLGGSIQRPVHVAFHEFADGPRLLVADDGELNVVTTAAAIASPAIWSVDPDAVGGSAVQLSTGIALRRLMGLAVRPDPTGGAELFVAADVEEDFGDAIFGDAAFTAAIDFEVYCFDGRDDEIDTFTGGPGDGAVDGADPDCGLPIRVQLLSLDLGLTAPTAGASSFVPDVLVTGFRRFPITESSFIPSCASMAPASVVPPTDLPDLVVEALAVGSNGRLVFFDPFRRQVGTFLFDAAGGVGVVPLVGSESSLARPFDGSNPLSTALDRPQGMYLDVHDNLYLADTTNNRVRRVWVGGILSAPIPPPIARFEAMRTTGDAPLAVAFQDTSAGQVTSRTWDFDDGTVSHEANPVHAYLELGSYDVTLTVANSGGGDALTRSGFVLVGGTLPNGGFDDQFSFSQPAAPWTTILGTHIVRDAIFGFGDAGMPTEGFQWVELDSTGVGSAVAPSNPGGFGDPPSSAAGISTDFSYPDGVTELSVRAVFVNGEGLGAFVNDFLSVDVSDGVDTFNVMLLDTTDPMPQTANPSGATASNLVATAVSTGSVDLAQVFPGSTPQTVFTLSIVVGNALDDVLPSFGYVDDIRLSVP